MPERYRKGPDTGPFFMKMKFRLLRVCFLVISCLIFSSVSAEAQTATKAQKKAEQKKEDQKRSAAKAEEEGRKRHYKLQSKDVKKRMKRNKKRYDHVDSFDRRPKFWQKLFPRKKPSAY